MDQGRLPKQLLYSQLKEGKQSQGRPGLSFKKHFKAKIKIIDVD